MADTRVRTTIGFKRRNASAEIACKKCGHTVIVAPGQVAALFQQPLTIAAAERRLVCSKCRCRWATIKPVFPKPR